MKLFLHLIIQFIITFSLVLSFRDSLGFADEEIPFFIGNALGSVIFPLVLMSIPAGIYKGVKKKKMPFFYISLWILWGLITSLSMYGNMLLAVENNMIGN